MQNTIAILRGLKERYESHHGVRITDGAIVAAATLSNRYIGDRFLPDKAIDLVDEAASRLRIEIDSLPQEIDEVERRVVQLEIERQALQKEKDAASKERRAVIERELAELKEKASGMRARQWQNEKGARSARSASSKQEIEEARGGSRPGNAHAGDSRQGRRDPVRHGAEVRSRAARRGVEARIAAVGRRALFERGSRRE